MPPSRPPRNILPSLLFLGAALWQYPCLAETQASDAVTSVVPVVFKPNVPFSADANISDAIRQQCGLNDAMVTSIQKYTGEFAVPLVSEEQTTAQPGRVVRVLSAEITNATPGLYAFSHWHTKPAILAVHFKVTEGDNVLLDTRRTCSSRKAGFLGMDGRACVKLKECVDEHGEYIGKWIKKKFYY